MSAARAENVIVDRRALLKGIAGAGAALGLLTACGGTNAKDQPASGTGGDGSAGDAESGTLNVWGGVPRESGPDDMFAAFMKKYPKIKVTYTRYVNDDPGNLKVDTSLQGGVPIDVIVSYGGPAVTKRATAGLLLDLTDRIAAENAFSMFNPGEGTANYVYDEKVYTVPMVVNPVTVMINQSMLDAKGITIPDNWTHEDFREIAKELSGQNVYGTFDIPPVARQELGANFTYKNDGTESNYDHPLFAKGTQLRVDMINEKSAIPMTEILAQKLQVYTQTPYLTGKVGMLINQPFILRYITDTKEYPHDFRTTLKPLPVAEAGKDYWNSGQYGDHVAITKRSTQQDAAWTLVKWWATEGGQYMVRGGRYPILREGLDVDSMVKTTVGPQGERLFDIDSVKAALFDESVMVPIDTIQTAAVEMTTIMTTLDQQVYMGKISVEEWAREAKKRCDAAIAKAG